MERESSLRAGSAAVAARARHVRVVERAIAPYARSLAGHVPSLDGPLLERGAREHACARVLQLDAINFGSGWFPTLNKRPGLSGYRTIAAGLDEHGPWSAEELRRITARELAGVLGQDERHELIQLFVASLRDLGRHIRASFAAVIPDSAVELVETLAAWDCFADTSSYDELTLPFRKRAQIAAADLQRAGAARFGDLDRLTIFADNLVPHVLVLDGVLELDPRLAAKIESETLLVHDSSEEIELRACAVHACELLVAELPGVCAAQLDALLWERGGGARYKAHPRPRCRTTAY